jgi:nicotinamide mononucleotide (NMN) deamidase PncC
MSVSREQMLKAAIQHFNEDPTVSMAGFAVPQGVPAGGVLMLAVASAVWLVLRRQRSLDPAGS